MGVEIFLKLDGIRGELLKPDHVGEIELSSWSWGTSNNGVNQVAAGGKATIKSINCTKTMDGASPLLSQYASIGKPIAKGRIAVLPTDKDDDSVIVLKMTDVLVAAYRTGAKGGGDNVPSESFTLNFEAFESKYAHLMNGPNGLRMEDDADGP